MKKFLFPTLLALFVLGVGGGAERAFAQSEGDYYALSSYSVTTSTSDKVIVEGSAYRVEVCAQRIRDQPRVYVAQFKTLDSGRTADEFHEITLPEGSDCASTTQIAPVFPSYYQGSLPIVVRILYVSQELWGILRPLGVIEGLHLHRGDSPLTLPEPTPVNRLSVPRRSPTSTPVPVQNVPEPTPTAYELITQGLKNKAEADLRARLSNEWQKRAIADDDTLVIRVHSPESFSYCEHGKSRLRAFERAGVSLLYTELVAYRSMLASCAAQPALVIVPEEGYLPPSMDVPVAIGNVQSESSVPVVASAPTATPVPGIYGNVRPDRGAGDADDAEGGEATDQSAPSRASIRLDAAPTPVTEGEAHWRMDMVEEEPEEEQSRSPVINPASLVDGEVSFLSNIRRFGTNLVAGNNKYYLAGGLIAIGLVIIGLFYWLGRRNRTDAAISA